MPRIEQHNLSLRIHIKRLAMKATCFSHSFEIYKKVIGAYIKKYYSNAFSL